MRAPSKKATKKELTSAQDPDLSKITPLEDEKGEPTTVTRAAPFRVSTLVAISPVTITNDFGTMSRHEGDPVPFEHQFYRTTLVGAFSLNVGEVGKFYYKRRTGFQNLDKVRRELAEKNSLTHLPSEFAYQLDAKQRLSRITALLFGLGRLYSGAKQSIHYTDVTPVVSINAVIRGGNNPFSHVFHHKQGIPVLNIEALQQVWADLTAGTSDTRQLLSPLFIGWKPGYLPEERAKLPQAGEDIRISTPRLAYEEMADWLGQSQNQHVLDVS
jgi:CRISPR-associated protein Cst2